MIGPTFIMDFKDIIQAEILSKRKALEEGRTGGAKKYIRRGDLKDSTRQENVKLVEEERVDLDGQEDSLHKSEQAMPKDLSSIVHKEVALKVGTSEESIRKV